MFSNLRGWEWLILLAVILLLFGAKRLPDAARGLGRSLRIFKAETKGLVDSDNDPKELPTEVAPPTTTPTPSTPPTPTIPTTGETSSTERTEGK